jgi:hypothetical protein
MLARAEDLARRWAIALILLRPLERLGEIRLGDLAREAPALCEQMVRALESDAELERMTRGGAPRGGAPSGRKDSGVQDFASARRLGALAGAREAGAAVEAIEALRGVLWEALMQELRYPVFDSAPARQVADLADRLAYVCATVLDATIAVPIAHAADTASREAEAPAFDSPNLAHDSDRDAIGPRRTVLVDEREDVLHEAPQSPSPTQAPTRPLPWDLPQPEPPPTPRTHTPPLPRDASPRRVDRAAQPPMPPVVPGGASVPAGPASPPLTSTPRIEIRDERGEEGPASWIRSIGRELQRFARDGLPFAVLLVELLDIDRPGRAELSGELGGLTSQVEKKLEEELQPIGDRPAGSLTRERPGRYWLLAPQTNGIAAEALAERLARTVRLLATRSGVGLRVAVGTAVCPEDGRGAAALAAHADLGLFSARAAGPTRIGRPIAPVDESA